jgi:hypothetical protein
MYTVLFIWMVSCEGEGTIFIGGKRMGPDSLRSHLSGIKEKTPQLAE